MNPLALNPWVILAVVSLWLGSLVGADHFGYTRAHNAEAAKQEKAERAALARERVLESDKSDLIKETIARDAMRDQQLEEAREHVRVVTRFITKQVPVYVSTLADSRCAVPAGFVQLHDAAARNVSPEGDAAAPATTGGFLVDRPSGVALSTVAATVTDNYGTCHDLETQVTGWKAYHADVDVYVDSVNAFLAKFNQEKKP